MLTCPGLYVRLGNDTNTSYPLISKVNESHFKPKIITLGNLYEDDAGINNCYTVHQDNA